MNVTWKRIKYSFKIFLRKHYLYSPLWNYFFSYISLHYDMCSELHGAKGLHVQWKTNKMFNFLWNCLKSNLLTILVGFEWFLIFLTLFNPLSSRIIRKLNFWYSDNSKNLKIINVKSLSLTDWISLIKLSNTVEKTFDKGYVYFHHFWYIRIRR